MKMLLSSTVALAVFLGPTLAETPETKYLEAAGARFPYVEQGEGEPVLFLHGAFADRRAWEGVREEVAERFRFIAVTQRHFGVEEWPDDKPYSSDVHEADLVAMLKAWDEPMHLVGWSYSGPVVLRAAMEAPELVLSVAIFEPTHPNIVAGTPEGDAALEEWGAGWAKPAEAAEAADYETAIERSLEYVFGMQEGGFNTFDAEVQTVFHENAHTIPGAFGAPEPNMTCEELARVEAPTLLMMGSETLPIWEVGTPVMADCIPNAELVVIEGAGHGAPLEAQDEFLRLLMDFLDRTARS